MANVLKPRTKWVEHPFAHQKGPVGLVIHTIGPARATATLANIAESHA